MTRAQAIGRELLAETGPGPLRAEILDLLADFEVDELAVPLLEEALAERFGGVTAYMRSPANGLWNDGVGGSRHDDVVLFEIMAETLEAPYWQTLKGKLADDFRQNDIVARVTEITRL